jgi:hypothetical protein
MIYEGIINPPKLISSMIPFQQAITRLKRDCMQKLRPQEVDVLTYPNGAHMTFGTSSPRVRFLEFLLIVKRSSEPHCNHLLANASSHHISSQR